MTPPPNQDKYKGSEKLTDAQGQVLGEAEKTARDKLEAKKVADQLLAASGEGKIKLPGGKEYSLTAEQKKELDSTLKGFIESGTKGFDKDREAGLDEKEWRALEQAINLEAEKWLKIAQEKAKEELKKGIDKISVSDVEAKRGPISALIQAHASYSTGDWKKINTEAAKIFGIKTEDNFDEDLSLRFGTKIQQLINSKLSSYDCGEAGKIGPLTMNGMAKMLAPEGQAQEAVVAPQPAPTQQVAAVPTGAAEANPGSSEAESPATAGVLETPPATHFEKERPAGFARLPEKSDAQKVFDQFNPKQKAEMMEALLADEKEKLTPQQQARLSQVSMFQTLLQSMVFDIDEARAPEEWAKQALTERTATTNQRKADVEKLLAGLEDAIKQIKADPNKKINDVIDPKILTLLRSESNLPDLREQVSREELKSKSPILGRLVGAGLDLFGGDAEKGAFLIDKFGKIKEAQSPEDLKLQYLSLFQMLRGTRNFATAQMIVEDQLFKDLFEAKKKELFDEKVQKKMYWEEYAKISAKFTPDVLQQYEDKSLTPATYIDALAKDSADRRMNKEIAKLNNGVPFPNLKGTDAVIMAKYKDMVGAGEWYNLSDETWDSIATEVVINAPLILVSGGLASLAAKGLTMGARALIAGGRLAKIGLTAKKVVDGTKVTYEAVQFVGGGGRLANLAGRNALRAGKYLGVPLAEGAVFETVHEGLTGELFKQDWTKLGTWGDWAKRCAVSGVTLKVFHGAGKLGAKADTLISKYITKVTDKSLKAMIQKLAVQKGSEVAAMVLVGAVQHGYVNGIEDMKDFDFWADQVFHAAVSVGALSIGGAGANRIVTIGGKVFRSKSSTETGGGAPSGSTRQTILEKIRQWRATRSTRQAGERANVAAVMEKVEPYVTSGNGLAEMTLKGMSTETLPTLKANLETLDLAATEIRQESQGSNLPKVNEFLRKVEQVRKRIEARERWEAKTEVEAKKKGKAKAEREQKAQEKAAKKQQQADQTKTQYQSTTPAKKSLIERWSESRAKGKAEREQKAQKKAAEKQRQQAERKAAQEVKERAKEAEKQRVEAEKEVRRKAAEEAKAKAEESSRQAREEAQKKAEQEAQRVDTESSIIKVGNEVYAKKSNGVVEKGWRVEKVNADGSFEVRSILDSNQTREQPQGTVWSIKDMEKPTDSKTTLRDDAADYVRRRIQVLRKSTSLSEAEFGKLFIEGEAMAQRNVGNCYLISALNSLRASSCFEALMRTSVKVVKGGWEVKLPLGDANGKFLKISQSDILRQRNPAFGKTDKYGKIDNREFLEPVSGPIGLQVLEAAYIKATTGGAPVTGAERLLVEGGFGHEALLELLGGSFNKIRIDGEMGRVVRGKTNYNILHTRAGYERSPVFEKGIEQARYPAQQERLRADITDFLNSFSPGKDIATVNTPPSSQGDAGVFKIDGLEFANQHAYSIVRTLKPTLSTDGVGRVFVTNPWNTAQIIELTYPQFMRTFSQVSAVEINYSKMFLQQNAVQKAAA